MKKIAASLLCLLLLSACGQINPAAKNTSNLSSELPGFLDLNANFSVSVLDTNSNTNNTAPSDSGDLAVNGNLNAAASLENANTNQAVIPTVTDPALLVPHEIAFDCKALKVYESNSWYAGFSGQFESLSRYSANDITNMIKLAKTDQEKQAASTKASQKESLDNISSSCLAKDGSMFLVVSEADATGYGFKVVRYMPSRGAVELAQREDERHGEVWSMAPLAFGRRSGTSLGMNVSGKEASLELSYDYVNNHILVSNYCEAKDGGKKECQINYPYSDK